MHLSLGLSSGFLKVSTYVVYVGRNTQCHVGEDE